MQHQVGQLQRRLAEELFGTLLLQGQQAALDGADRGLADVAVGGGQLVGVLRHRLQHRRQVLEVEQQQALVVGELEGDVEHALLGVVELEHAGQQQRPHLGDGGADRVALRAEQVPEDHRCGGAGVVGLAEFGRALRELRVGRTCLGDAGEVALHVGAEHRHAGAAEALGQHLQGDGLAGAGGARHETVPVSHRQIKELLLLALADQQLAGVVHRPTLTCSVAARVVGELARPVCGRSRP